MSAKYKSPSFLLPNEINTNTNPLNTDSDPATGTGVNSLYSMDFNGNDEYISAGSIDITGNKTLSMWFKTSSINTNQGLFEMMPDPNTSDYLSVWIYNSKIITDAANSGSSQKASSVLNANTWYNLVITKTSGVINNVYINGVDDTQTSATGLGWLGGRNNLYIGATYQGTAYANEFAGLISNAQIFNTVLSATEVSTLYNYGSPIRTLANIPQNSNLKACLLYTSPSPRDRTRSRMPSSA